MRRCGNVAAEECVDTENKVGLDRLKVLNSEGIVGLAHSFSFFNWLKWDYSSIASNFAFKETDKVLNIT